ncbi:MAG: glycosyltransferase [Sphingobacteriales bacterium]|nr:MAG: glycosyltransferase [Sphingobacteriales bacterium]
MASLCFLCGVIAQILLCVFLFSIIVQYGYIFRIFSHFFFPAENYRIVNRKPVSVIICARNEAENLRKNLPAVLSQRYTNETGNPLFEVVVVNDGSEDDTEMVLAELSRQYGHLSYVNIPHDIDRRLPGKKEALRKGASTAQYDYLLMTDADCTPASEHWLEHMVSPLHDGKAISAGYGKFRQEAGWLNTFIRWETVHTFLQYSSYARAGRPYMAVGRNIACTKNALLQAQQSEAWAKLPSGDDDLLINTVATKDNLAIISDPEAFTISDAKQTYADWVAQKQRHFSTGKYYRPANWLLVGGYAVVHALTWLLFFLLLVIGDRETVLIAMALRCLPVWILWKEAAKQTHEKGLTLFFPLMDIGWMIYNFAFAPFVLWKNKQQWK